jgi:hypothetical protein
LWPATGLAFIEDQKLWERSFDYRVGNTRVVCNPRGYAKNGINENPEFNPALVLNLDL